MAQKTAQSCEIEGQAARRQRVQVGRNDLATMRPDLVAEALFDATTVAAFSHRDMPWRCSNGHEWTAKVSSRSKGNGCPVCSNYRTLPGVNDLATTHPELAKEAMFDPTTVTAGSEKKLPWRCSLGHEWEANVFNRATRGKGCPFCRSVRVWPGFNDLATVRPDLVGEALFDATAVTEFSHKKLPWRCAEGHEWTAVVAKRASGHGCPICSGRKVLPGANDLATVRPDLADEALFDATTVTAFSHRKLPWRCALGHEWQAPVANRTNVGSGCPFCAGKAVLPGFNDLATVRPDLVGEALFDATTVTAFSHKKLQWRCAEGHEWKAVVAKRAGGRGCPTCAKTGYSPAEPGWLYLLQHHGWEMLQIGMTNEPEVRLPAHGATGWVALDLRGPMDGAVAREWERSILMFLRASGVELGTQSHAGKFMGYTEAWRAREWAVTTLRELMQAVQEWEDAT